MPLTTLDLDPLYLTYLTEKLRLNVTSSADFRVPDVALHQLALSKALESGVVWVGSTRVIRLSIHIFFNDRHLDTEERARILEPLGNCILNSKVGYFFLVKSSTDAIKLWCQLSLSPSLEIPSFDNANTAQADLSILLDQYSPTTASVPQPRGWILDNLDVHVPPSVLSVQFEKLHVNLKFSSLQEQCLSASKRLKIHEEDTYSTLPDPPTDETEAHLEKLEEAVDKLAHRLPSLMAKCLGLPEASSPTYFTESDPNALPASTILYRQPSKSLNTTHQLPTDAKNKLRVWLDKHLDNPYPTREEKLHLMQQSGLQWSMFCHSLPCGELSADYYHIRTSGEMVYKIAP
jgi:hypothetical protein